MSDPAPESQESDPSRSAVPAETQQTDRLGLLDLSVDLSAPEVYSGSDFTLYLHIKNPFAGPVWIRSVELSLPTQLAWRDRQRLASEDGSESDGDRTALLLKAAIRDRRMRIAELQEKSSKRGSDETREEIKREIDRLEWRNQEDIAFLAGVHKTTRLVANNSATFIVDGVEGDLDVVANNSSTVSIRGLHQRESRPARVPLVGSLPSGSALQPGSTDVWTIRLGSSRNPLFIPARYRLQLTVIYSMVALGEQQSSHAFHANTTAVSLSVRAALWTTILGSLLGSLVGSVGRSLQDARTFSHLVGDQLGASVGGTVLALILAAAAVVFASRRSEAQSFVTVEDFWGGALVGFLIGYSGTAAFSSITGVDPAGS